MTSNDKSQAYVEGEKIRRKVIGDAHVDTALAKASSFSMPAQILATEHAWSGIWSRPGLTHRDRSLITLAILTTLGKQQELGVHVRGAVNNGCTEEEIREVLLQAMVYTGMPTGLEAFRTADAMLQTIAKEKENEK